MSRYLLGCECGASVVVEPGQAGESVRCQCGAVLQAPSLRKIRELPPAEAAGVEPSGSRWEFRQGVLTAGLLATAVLGIVGGYCWMAEPLPAEKQLSASLARQVQNIDRWTPVQAWVIWAGVYRSELADGSLGQRAAPVTDRIEIEIASYRLGRNVSFGLAALIAGASLVAFLAAPGESASG